MSLDYKVAVKALDKADGNMSKAARSLKVPLGTFRCSFTKADMKVVDEELHLVEEHKLKVQLKELKKQNKDLIEEAVRRENLSDTWNALASTPLDPPVWLGGGRRSGKEENTAVAILSDCHFGEVVTPEEVNFVNEYNSEIAEERLEQFFKKIIKLTRHYIKGIKVDKLVLCLAGDIISGEIHDLAESNEGHSIENVIHWSERIAAGIDLLLKHFKKVHVVSVSGNHGRLAMKVKTKHGPQQNWDWLIAKLIEKQFRNAKNITFQIPNCYECYFSVYDVNFLVHHGMSWRGGSGISGILTPVSLGAHRMIKKGQSIGKRVDHILCGHFHTQHFLPAVTVNGSLIGYSEFPSLMNFPAERAQQTLLLIDPREGLTMRVPIHVS